MASPEERLKILSLIQEGKLTPEDGLRLLDALNKSLEPKPIHPVVSPARWLRILITDLASGKTRVNVRLPVTVLHSGIKIGARFSAGIGQMEMDQILEAVRSGTTGKVLDITDKEDGEHIQIMLE